MYCSFPTAIKVCGPVDECKFNNGRCSQLCVDTYDSYYCTCRDGYQLVQNDYTCPGKSYQLSRSVVLSQTSLECEHS